MRRLAEFEGDWHLSREIVTHGAGRSRFEGRASFQPDGDGFAYLEEGVLTLAGGESLKAERRYLWSEPSPGTISVRFGDGRSFHEFRPESASTATHDCPPDTYVVAYDFGRWPVWTATWTVTGPRKSYVMQSVYRRAAA